MSAHQLRRVSDEQIAEIREHSGVRELRQMILKLEQTILNLCSDLEDARAQNAALRELSKGVDAYLGEEGWRIQMFDVPEDPNAEMLTSTWFSPEEWRNIRELRVRELALRRATDNGIPF